MSRGKRSGEAQAAQHRKAGPMKHRLEPRGGSQKPDWDYKNPEWEYDEPDELHRYDELTPLEQRTVVSLINHIASLGEATRYSVGDRVRKILVELGVGV